MFRVLHQKLCERFLLQQLVDFNFISIIHFKDNKPKNKPLSPSVGRKLKVRRSESLSDDDDDIFGFKNKAFTSPRNKDTEIADSVNNAYDFLLTGNSTSSFPTASMDFTFNPAPIDVTPTFLPNMTKKSKQSTRSSEGDKEQEALNFVIDKWRTGSQNRRSMKRRKNSDMMEENGVNMSKMSLGSSDASLKVVSKWKTIRRKDI